MSLYKRFSIPFTNLYFLRWYPKSKTDVHGHSKRTTNQFVIKGLLRECVYRNNETGYYILRSQLLRKHSCSYINDTIGYHTIENLSDKPTWTLNYDSYHK